MLNYRSPNIFDTSPALTLQCLGISCLLTWLFVDCEWMKTPFHCRVVWKASHSEKAKHLRKVCPTLRWHWVDVSCASANDSTAKKQTGTTRTSEAFEKLHLIRHVVHKASWPRPSSILWEFIWILKAAVFHISRYICALHIWKCGHMNFKSIWLYSKSFYITMNVLMISIVKAYDRTVEITKHGHTNCHGRQTTERTYKWN